MEGQECKNSVKKIETIKKQTNKQKTFRLQFQIFRKLSQDPVATAIPSSVTPRQLTRLSCPANTPGRDKGFYSFLNITRQYHKMIVIIAFWFSHVVNITLQL